MIEIGSLTGTVAMLLHSDRDSSMDAQRYGQFTRNSQTHAIH